MGTSDRTREDQCSASARETTPKMMMLTAVVVGMAAVAVTGQDSSSDLIAGTYRYQSATNFNSYLKEVGVNFIFRRLAALARPVVTITGCPESDCSWQIKTKTLVVTETVNFQLGQVFPHTTMDGRDIRVTVTKMGNNQLIERQFGRTNTTITRTFTNDKMEVNLEANGVIANSVFTR